MEYTIDDALGDMERILSYYDRELLSDRVELRPVISQLESMLDIELRVKGVSNKVARQLLNAMKELL